MSLPPCRERVRLVGHMYDWWRKHTYSRSYLQTWRSQAEECNETEL